MRSYESYALQKLQQTIVIVKRARLPRNVKGNLIESYDDFLREKGNLKTHYHFSLPVFNALIRLADELWSDKRRFRCSELLHTMLPYLKRGNYKLDDATKINLFGLFKKMFADNDIDSSLAEICFMMLRDFSLSAEYEVWLCERAEHATPQDWYFFAWQALFSRILNYPAASTIITKWISENFNHREFHCRRYKAIAWLLNENEDYIVDDQTLMNDFEFINWLDAQVMCNWYHNWDGNTPCTYTDRRLFNRRCFIDGQPVREDLYARPYCSVICKGMGHGEAPDFTALRKFFAENLPDIKAQTMLWAVACSKLPVSTKQKLLKKYYSPFCFWTLLNIAKRYNLLAILEWLKKQALPANGICEIEIGKKLLPEEALKQLEDWSEKYADFKDLVEVLNLDLLCQDPF
jgi:hypothetical protein